MTSYEKAAIAIRSYRGKANWLGRPATEDAIVAAEDRLGVHFPSSYRTYLGDFGWGGLGSWAYVCGTGEGVEPAFDVVGMTEDHRTNWASFNPSLVAVAGDGGGNTFCLDTSRMEDEECPMVFWVHDEIPQPTPEPVAATFGDWLLARLREAPPDDWESSRSPALDV